MDRDTWLSIHHRTLDLDGIRARQPENRVLIEVAMAELEEAQAALRPVYVNPDNISRSGVWKSHEIVHEYACKLGALEAAYREKMHLAVEEWHIARMSAPRQPWDTWGQHIPFSPVMDACYLATEGYPGGYFWGWSL